MVRHAGVEGMTIESLSGTKMTRKDEQYPRLSFPRSVQFSIGRNVQFSIGIDSFLADSHPGKIGPLVRRIAEVDDPSVPRNPFNEIRVGPLQAVQSFADDLEFSFDHSLGQRAAGIGTDIHTSNEVLDIRTCLVDIR